MSRYLRLGRYPDDVNEPHSTLTDAGQGRDTGDRAEERALVLHTSLLGELVIPDEAGRADGLADLARRATQYATRRAYRSAGVGYVP